MRGDLLVVLGAALALAGCGSEMQPREARKVTSLTPAQVAGDDAFAWSLYGELAKQPGNLFLSPFSIESALGMTYAGARGQTATEMHDALRVSTDDATFHAGIGGLARDLSGDKGRGYTLYVANRLFGQSGFAFHTDFTDLLKADYGADLEPVDFAGAPEDARSRVNSWADDATRGTIPPLLPPGSVDASTKLVLANAIYFKAAWAHAFDPRFTHDVPFYKADGSTAMVPMMQSTEVKFSYAGDELASVAELPYLDDEVSMLLVVPNAIDGLADVEAALSSGWLDGIVAKLGAPFPLPVGLPRFTTRWHASLIAALQALGMTSAFGDADFSGIADDSLFIAAVEHSAFVQVDEAGTTAAAATAVSTNDSGGGPSVFADHPFLFVIRDRLTGTILFVGRIDDPTDKGAAG